MKGAVSRLYIMRFLWWFFLFIPISSDAQNFLGISINAGNSLKYSPVSRGLRKPVSISGSLAYVRQQGINSKLGIQFQGGVGIMGFNLKVVTKDTISKSGSEEISPFIEYIIFYTNAGTLFTKKLSVHNRQAYWGLGGGVTYYYCPFPSLEYSTGIIKDDNSEWDTFTSYMQRSSKKIFGFASAQIGINLTKQLLFSLSYVHHFASIYKGSYEFFHTINPAKGNIYLYQREIKIGILWKLNRSEAKG